MNEKLTKAVENLYKIFGGEPKPHYVDGCLCCIENKEIGSLLSKPLLEITPNELSSYASSLFLTVGSESDFLYFLPRIFQISVTDDTWWPDPEIALGKLRYVEWTKWKSKKKEATEMFVEAVFDEKILETTAEDDIDSWLCAIAGCVDDISPYLKRIEENQKVLVILYEINSVSLQKGKLSNGFWDDVPEAKKKVINWFLSEAVMNFINDNYRKLYK